MTKIHSNIKGKASYIHEVFSYSSEVEYNADKNPFQYFARGLGGVYYIESESKPKLRYKGKLYNIPQLFLFGQSIYPKELVVNGSFQLIIVYLDPFAINDLFCMNASDLVDDYIDLARSPISGSQRLFYYLNLSQTLEEKISNVTTYLEYITDKKKRDAGTDFKFCVSTERSISRRTFQRFYKKHMGISPSKYAQILKFNQALERLILGKYSSLTQLALEMDYTDQSHFIRVFKKFTGVTPRRFIKENSINTGL